jgi:2-keto-4-pentenoate hydratase/2-oxohepta-3-ene-1,7-dioic acid hydratase in catechol pathway
MRLGEPGNERPAVRHDGAVFDLGSLTADITGDFLGDGDLDRVRTDLSAGNLSIVDETGQRVGAPVAKAGAVVCIGQNYAAHAAESGSAPPERPIVFFKHPNTVVGPHDRANARRPSTPWLLPTTEVRRSGCACGAGSTASRVRTPAPPTWCSRSRS